MDNYIHLQGYPNGDPEWKVTPKTKSKRPDLFLHAKIHVRHELHLEHYLSGGKIMIVECVGVQPIIDQDFIGNYDESFEYWMVEA